MNHLSLLFCLLFQVTLIATTFAVPDSARRGRTNVKSENGSTIVWLPNSVAHEPQVHVFSNSGCKRFEIDLVSHLSGTSSAGINDVSVGKSGRMAAGAAAVGADRRVVALLLLFSPDGKLTRAVGLDSAREITRLAVDDDDSIWTLCGDGDGQFLVHCSPLGRELGAFVSRSEIPEAADSVDDLKSGAFTSFGLRGDRVWFWVAPASTFVSVNRDGSILARERVSLERPAGVSTQANAQGGYPLDSGSHNM